MKKTASLLIAPILAAQMSAAYAQATAEPVSPNNIKVGPDGKLLEPNAALRLDTGQNNLMQIRRNTYSRLQSLILLNRAKDLFSKEEMALISFKDFKARWNIQDNEYSDDAAIEKQLQNWIKNGKLTLPETCFLMGLNRPELVEPAVRNYNFHSPHPAGMDANLLDLGLLTPLVAAADIMHADQSQAALGKLSNFLFMYDNDPFLIRVAQTKSVSQQVKGALRKLRNPDYKLNDNDRMDWMAAAAFTGNHDSSLKEFLLSFAIVKSDLNDMQQKEQAAMNGSAFKNTFAGIQTIEEARNLLEPIDGILDSRIKTYSNYEYIIEKSNKSVPLENGRAVQVSFTAADLQLWQTRISRINAPRPLSA